MAHTLTFTSEFQVLVNGTTAVSSPYTLQDGDVLTIQVSDNLGGYRFFALYGDGPATDLYADNPPNLSVSDSDIELWAESPGGN